MKFIYITLFLGLLLSFSLGRRIHESNYALSSSKVKPAKLGAFCDKKNQCEKGLICYEENIKLKFCIKPEEKDKITVCLNSPICSKYLKKKFIGAEDIPQYGKENEECDYLFRCNEEENKSLKCVYNGKKEGFMDYRCIDTSKKKENEPKLDRCLLGRNGNYYGIYCEKGLEICFEYDEGYFCRENLKEDKENPGGLCVVDYIGELFCSFDRKNKMNEHNKCRCFNPNEGDYNQKCTEKNECTYGNQCIEIADGDFRCLTYFYGKIGQKCINEEICEFGATCEKTDNQIYNFLCFGKDKGHYDQECLDELCVQDLSCSTDDLGKKRCFKREEGWEERECTEGRRCRYGLACKNNGGNDFICFDKYQGGYQEECKGNKCLKPYECKEVSYVSSRCLPKDEGGYTNKCSSKGFCEKDLTCKQVGKNEFKCLKEDEGEYEKKCAADGSCRYGLFCKKTKNGDFCFEEKEGQYDEKCSASKMCKEGHICREVAQNDFRCLKEDQGNEGQSCSDSKLCIKGNFCIEVAEGDLRCLSENEGKINQPCANDNLCMMGLVCALKNEGKICLSKDDVGDDRQYCFEDHTCKNGFKCLEYLNLPNAYGTNFLCSKLDKKVLFTGFETVMGEKKNKRSEELCKENSVLDPKKLPFYVFDKKGNEKEFICREHQTVPKCINDEDCDGMPKINNHFPKCRQYKSKPKEKYCFYSSFKEDEPEDGTFQEVTPYIFLKRCNKREDCGDKFFYCIKPNPNGLGYCTNLYRQKTCDQMKETFLMNPFYEGKELEIGNFKKHIRYHRFCVPHQE